MMVRRRSISPVDFHPVDGEDSAFYFILIITVISILGIPTSSFLALFASAGVAIGMALGGTLRTLRAASHTPRPYRIGGNFVIEAQGYSGTVKEDHRYSTHHHHHRRQQDHHIMPAWRTVDRKHQQHRSMHSTRA